MNPAFRVLTCRTRSMDEAIYDTFQKPKRESWWLEGIVSLITSGYLCVRFFIWGFGTMDVWDLFLSIASVILLIISVRSMNYRMRRRERYLNEMAAKRKERAGSRDSLTAVLFYGDHLVQYDMIDGKAQRVDYEEIKGIRQSPGYVFLLIKNQTEMICLEKAGFAGKAPHYAVNWLVARCRCRFPK